MYLLKVFLIKTLSTLVLLGPIPDPNPSHRTRTQDLHVTIYDFEDNQQRTLHNYAVNQVKKCESEPQDTKSTTIVATL